ncbi:DUF1775 domain-containing protein [Kitasatospora indigofera]|uniref:DUF1775 domain-containing protein n=1 Tax=Kitasatospora indigofera TaxID=67307 RepID=UPI003695209D
MNRTRSTARAVTGAALVAGALALAAGPAFAHVEVEAENAQALATGVTVSFNAEAESTTAGVTSLRVVLPAGIAPADVTLAQGPDGWTLTPAEDGYTVSGPAVTPGKDVAYKVTVRQLPDAKELAFKTLQTYSDGRVDRWIELPQNGAKPDKPAPVLQLKAAAPGATPVAPSPTVPSPSATPSATPTPTPTTPATSAAAPAPAPAPSTAPKADAEDDSSSATPIVIAAVAAAALAAGGAWWWLRRRDTSNG